MINFNAGPAHLPEFVIAQARESLLDFKGTGIGILETPHRGKAFLEMMEETACDLLELMQLPDTRKVLFLTGGASTQFFMVPANLLPDGGMAAYADTGNWAALAMKEALHYGMVHTACSAKADHYRFIPTELDVPESAAYLHLTSNNTIYGTQWNKIPESQVPLVVDMSSDILSKPYDYEAMDLIYAGAQKNLGAAGVTLVVLNPELLEKKPRALPSMLDYRVHLAKDSVYNTPPVFAIYVTHLMLKWMKAQGLNSIHAANRRKAQQLYDYLDASALYRPTVLPGSRSDMNVCFVLSDTTKEEVLNEACKKSGITGIKGHRNVGGYRISLYNAIPESWVAELISVLKAVEAGG